jgi:hypothetical protein
VDVKLEETITIDFITSHPTTGAAADADSAPSVEVFEDASDTAILAPTATKRVGKTGNYRVTVACTAVNGFEPGKSYNVVASATVATVAGKAVIGSFQVRNRSIDDVSTFAGGPVQSVTNPVTVGTNNDKSGYILAPAGLDQVLVESGVNLRQGVSVILASAAGKLAGAGTGTITVFAGANPGTQRISAAVDGAGNRTTVTLSLPA